MLYYPWCDEEELKGDYLTYEAHWNEDKDVVYQIAKQFNQTADTHDIAVEAFNENTIPKTALDSIMPTIQEKKWKYKTQGYDSVHQLNDGDNDSKNEEISIAELQSSKSRRPYLSMLFTKEAQKGQKSIEGLQWI